MATIGLRVRSNHDQTFRYRILRNIQYWGDRLRQLGNDSAVLEQHRNQILTALTFALDDNQARPYAYAVIEQFAGFMERRGYWQSWHQILDRAQAAARRSTDLAHEVQMLALLARLLQRENRLREAIRHYRRLIYLSREAQDAFNEARAYTNLGFLYSRLEFWYRAEVLCWRALKRFEEINNNYGRAHTENHLGILFTKTSRWAFAADHLNRACAIWQEMGDNHGLMKGLINLSSLYIDSERPTEAIYHLKKAVEQAELTGDVVEYGTIYLNMSAAYNLSGDYVTGAAYAYQAETLFQQYANKYYLAITWGNLGASLVGQGKWLEADHYLRASIETCRKLGNKYEEINALSHKVKLELARGDQVEAAKFIKKLENLAAQYRRQEVFKKKIALKLKEFGRELGK